MKHFELDVIAKRYESHRPKVHGKLLDEVFLAHEIAPLKGQTALDVACGTAHSTEPLKKYCDEVFGCDVSASMVAQAQVVHQDIEFKVCPAEALDYADETFDLITVGFAFHWFDQAKFISEACRVLKPGGMLLAYNMIFPGLMEENFDYKSWHQEVYWKKYPNPERKLHSLQELLSNSGLGLVFLGHVDHKLPLMFSAKGLTEYLTTQSNISLALENGEDLSDIDHWLLSSVSPFFKDSVATFKYYGRSEIAIKQ